MRKLLYISLIAALVGSFTSCKDQDDIYKEWVVPGGSIYPEKANGLRAILGSGRVQLKWAAPKDPAVKRAVITWDNGEKTREISYADFEGQDSILVEINDLKEQSHSFTITNYDAENHVSMTSEKSASPYGAIWLSTHAERTIKSAEMNGADANVALGFGTNEMVATKFRYLNADGEWVITEPVPSAQASTVFANAKGGVRYQYSSGYCPAEGLDTIWNDWSKSPTPIASRLDPSEWEVTATGWNAATPPSKVFDGLVTTDMTKAWVWNNGGKWPVVLQIDMKKSSYVINRMVAARTSWPATWVSAAVCTTCLTSSATSLSTLTQVLLMPLHLAPHGLSLLSLLLPRPSTGVAPPSGMVMLLTTRTPMVLSVATLPW